MMERNKKMSDFVWARVCTSLAFNAPTPLSHEIKKSQLFHNQRSLFSSMAQNNKSIIGLFSIDLVD
jgi:hypothetical protein